MFFNVRGRVIPSLWTNDSMLGRLIHFNRHGLSGGAGARTQVGAIPYALEDGVPVFLLVTSRRTGRWIFPKGACRSDEEASSCAAREAFEEAGVEGKVSGAPVGAYGDRKHGAGPLKVEMYPLHVTRQHDDWPEKAVRRRHWATLGEARTLLSTPGLIDLVERADGRIRADILAGRQQRKAKIQ